MNLLLVGLGNPDSKYANTRHNAGFMFVDWIFRETQDAKRNTWNYDKYVRSEVAEVTLRDGRHTILATLAKPQTYMNASGDAVKKLLATYHDTRYTLCVVHDDLDIRLGSFKVQKGVGPKVHNGIASIERSLKTSDFWRVRIGIDNRDSDFAGSGEGYVLSQFSSAESLVLPTVFQQSLSKLQLLMR